MSLAKKYRKVYAAIAAFIIALALPASPAFAADPTPSPTVTADVSASAEATPAPELAAPSAPAETSPATADPTPVVEPSVPAAPAPEPVAKPVPVTPAPASEQAQVSAPTNDAPAPAADAPAPPADALASAPAPAVAKPDMTIQEEPPSSFEKIYPGGMIRSTTENGVYIKPFSLELEYVGSDGKPLPNEVFVPEGERLYVEVKLKDEYVTKYTLVGDTNWYLKYFVVGEPQPVFVNVTYAFSWIDNPAGRGKITITNTEAHPVMAAAVAINAATSQNDGWQDCLTPDGTVINRLTGFYPIGTTECVLAGLKNGTSIWIYSQSETPSVLFWVTGVDEETQPEPVSVEPVQVTSDGTSITVPTPTERYVYRGADGEIITPGTYPIPVGETFVVNAVSLSNEVTLTGTTHWEFPYTPKQAPAPGGAVFDDEKDTITVSGAAHWSVTINGQDVTVPAGESLTLPAAPYTSGAGHDGLVTVVYAAEKGYVDGTKSQFDYSFRFTVPGQEPPVKEDNTTTKFVDICHANGDGTFVVAHVNVASIINAKGHAQHQDGQDMIPEFTYIEKGESKSFPGQNWDQSIYNKGCQVLTENPNPEPNPGDGDGGNHGEPGGEPGDHEHAGDGHDHSDHDGHQPSGPGKHHSGHQSGEQPSTQTPSTQVTPLGGVQGSDNANLGQGAVENSDDDLWYYTETAARGGYTLQQQLAPVLIVSGSAIAVLLSVVFVRARRREE